MLLRRNDLTFSICTRNLIYGSVAYQRINRKKWRGFSMLLRGRVTQALKLPCLMLQLRIMVTKMWWGQLVTYTVSPTVKNINHLSPKRLSCCMKLEIWPTQLGIMFIQFLLVVAQNFLFVWINLASLLSCSCSLKKLLHGKARAFLSNDYYESDIAWMELVSHVFSLPVCGDCMKLISC